MIEDRTILNQLNAEWDTVEEMLLDARWSWTQVETAPGLIEFSRDLATLASNLCVIFAISVLEKALLQLRDEKVFACNGCALGSLMAASRAAGLPWVNYDSIDEIRRQRNTIAHERTRFSEDECLAMVLAIGEELKAWSIVTTPNDRFFSKKVLMTISDDAGEKHSVEIVYPPLQKNIDAERVVEEAVHTAHLSSEWISAGNAESQLDETAKKALTTAGFSEQIEYKIRIGTHE